MDHIDENFKDIFLSGLIAYLKEKRNAYKRANVIPTLDELISDLERTANK